MAKNRIAPVLLCAAAGLCWSTTALAQQDPECRRQNYSHVENGNTVQGTNGPDVIVGDLIDTNNYGAVTVNGVVMRGYAVGTTSCNIGDDNLLWIAGNNQHPVIGQTMYRLKNGMLEQIGQSWLKHGFTALTQNVCGTCSGQGGSVLGVGCSDPYTAGLNGSQGNGPKWDVNAANGFYTYPHPGRHVTSGDAIFKRLQVRQTDLAPAGAGESPVLFFVEGQYVAADDATFNNGANNLSNNENNVSYRRVTVANTGANPSYNLSLANQTQCTSPAIFAWRDYGLGLDTTPPINANGGEPDNSVQIVPVDVPGDGRFWVACKVVDNGNGTWTYNYAIQNITSHRSASKFRVPVSPADQITGIWFRDVPYHSGEKCDNADWSMNKIGNDVIWECIPNTEPDPVPPPANWYSNFDSDGTSRKTNALRWNTMYNYSFTSVAAPIDGTAELTLFRPGTPSSMEIPIKVPGIAGPAPLLVDFNGTTPAYINPGQVTPLNVTINLRDDTLTEALLHYRSSPSDAYSTLPLVDLGGNQFRADLPGMLCGTAPQFFVSAIGSVGQIDYAPDAGAAAALTAIVGQQVTRFNDNCETDTGWTIGGTITSATAGRWERAVPLSGGRADPPADGDGSGRCYVTGNNVSGGGNNTDVDGGTTTLTTPPMDASNGQTSLSYYRWFDNGVTGSTIDDGFLVEISNDGSNFVTLESIAFNSPEANGTWFHRTFNIANFVTPTSTVYVRFTASDTGAGSVVEAGVDGMELSVLECVDPPQTGACCLADGSCSTTSEAGCSGVYQGNGTLCENANCPQPTGACCLADGSCTDVTEEDCTATDGAFQGDGSTCGGANCPQPTGACCLDRCTCIVATEAACAEQGGVFGGVGATCDPASCFANPTCACDWNGVDGLDSQDFFDFNESFFSGDADMNCVDGTDSQDFFDFNECFFTSCN